MFRITQSPKFWAEVQGEVQGENGARLTVRFDAEFKRLDVDAVRDFAERTRAKMVDAVSVIEPTTEMLSEIVCDWRKITNDANEPLEFNVDNLRQVVALGMGAPILSAFYAALPRAKAKN